MTDERTKQCDRMEQTYLEVNAQQSNDRNLATEAGETIPISLATRPKRPIGNLVNILETIRE